MQVITIGYSLPNTKVDNHNVLNAPSYTDYEALFVNPSSITTTVSELLEGNKEFSAQDGRPIINGSTTASAVAAADQVRRRSDETRRVLDQGGIVTVMTNPNATQSGLINFEGCDRYSWLPAPQGVHWGGTFLKAAEGKNIRIVDEYHPFASVIRKYRKQMYYRAVFDEEVIKSIKGASVLAVGGSSLPIAVEIPVLAGKVIFLPMIEPITGTVRGEIATEVVEALDAVQEGASGEKPPSWASALALPGLEQLEAEMEEMNLAVQAAIESQTAVSDQVDELAKHRRLLWSSGPAFQEAVRESLLLLGFESKSEPGNPLEIGFDDRLFAIEVESTSDQVTEWPYVRLQRRLEELLLKDNVKANGLVIVNGKRTMQPGRREPEFVEPLRIACENYGYGLMTGETLFTLMQRILASKNPDEITPLRQRVLGAKGLLTTDAAVGEGEEEQAGGQIF